MPSMSYCMFENTTLEMDQLLSAMEEATNMEDLDLNQYEKNAFERLVHQCQAFLKQAEWLTEASEEVDLADRCFED